jgi:CRP-like cAMP-binding protein
MKTPHSLVQTLKAIPDFSALDEDSLLSFVGESMNLFWNEGSTIFDPGDPGDALYVVLDGEVSITQPDGTEVAYLQPGQFFGEMSLLTNAVHSKKAVAVRESEILVVAKEAFTDLLEANPKVASHFDQIITTRQGSLREASG